MKFVDEVVIEIRSGKGGDGCASFLRERFKPRGGPDGGDGGKGGDVVFVADRNLHTLLDFRYRRHHRAENGHPGMGRQKYGRFGSDAVVRVPVGTVIGDEDTTEIIADLCKDGERVVVARGGQGGRGNIHFKSSTNQAPRYAEKGQPAVERRIRLTLKLLADVGLVGFPNVGKSTLISRLSAARPKIADYPFTTLAPNLGLVRTDLDRSFVVADIPGLIEGASEGHGLGHRFLKHVERVVVNAILLSVSPEEGRDPVRDYGVLMAELEAFREGLSHRPRIIVLTKGDLPETSEVAPRVRALAEVEGLPFFQISSVSGEGLDILRFGLQALVDQARESNAVEDEAAPDDTGSIGAGP